MRAFYSLHAIQNRLPPLRLNDAKDGGFPDLHGTAVKTTHTRCLAPFAREMQRRAMVAKPTAVTRH
eukprot:9560482-Lingulodinium_polyedra.AAC.1